MSSRADLDGDFEKLRHDATQLRMLNTQMLAALQYVLPILRDALPETVDFDWTKAAVEKVQNAIADAERDA
jgi:hypothetical protein